MGVDFLGKGEIASLRSEIAEHSRWVIAPEERKRDLTVAAPGIPPPKRPQRRRRRPGLRARARFPGGGRQPGSGRPGRAVGRTGRRGRGVIAGVRVAVARQALIAHGKAGTAVRLKGGRTGVPETWQPVDGELAPGPDLDAGRLVR